MNAKIVGLFGLMVTLALVSGCQTTTVLDGSGSGDEGAAGTTSIETPGTTTLALRADNPVTAAVADDRPFAALIATHAAANDVPVDLAHAVVYSESSYRPNARGAAGEIGLMQIRLGTARMLGYTGSAKGLYDPETNIRYGMKYLGGAHDLAGGSTCGTILRYNAGHAARRMNPVSQRYCNKVARLLDN
ncbi:lytic transglycosylase domain-containing protein [Oceaniradius stylonematis]|uniref:lytic transglycosylase domain-containing protein n=1 Tax=Oceaniradius stylonematis TaxID=2184161 RepID=UPI000F401F0F|nr:MAG: lytic transglycosylase domain-containing protein [Oricola sp.]